MVLEVVCTPPHVHYPMLDPFGLVADPDDLQLSPIFRAYVKVRADGILDSQNLIRVGSRGYFFFLLFQCFINGVF